MKCTGVTFFYKLQVLKEKKSSAGTDNFKSFPLTVTKLHMRETGSNRNTRLFNISTKYKTCSSEHQWGDSPKAHWGTSLIISIFLRQNEYVWLIYYWVCLGFMLPQIFCRREIYCSARYCVIDYWNTIINGWICKLVLTERQSRGK